MVKTVTLVDITVFDILLQYRG